MYNLKLGVTIPFQETNKKIKDLVIKDTKEPWESECLSIL